MSFHGQRSKSKRKQRVGFTIFHANEPVWDKPKPKFKLGDIPKPVLTLLFLGLMSIPAIFAGSYGYYTFHVLPSQQADPFTTLWNGEIPSSVSSFVSVGFNDFCSASTNCLSSSFTLTGKDLILVTGWHDGGCNPGNNPTISDTAGNTFNLLGSVSGFGNWSTTSVAWGYYSISTFSGPDVVTTNCPAIVSGYTVIAYHGFNALGNEQDSGSLIVPNPNTKTVSVSSGSMVFEMSSAHRGLSSCPTVTQTSANTRHQSCNAGQLSGSNSELTVWGDSGPYTSAQSVSQTATFGLFDAFWHSLIEVKGSASPACFLSAYQCFNSKISNGDITQLNTTSSVAVALTNSSVDLSTGASKALSFSQGMWGLTCPAPNCSGLEWGWFLTLNGTITNNPSYSPTNDTSVALAEIVKITSKTFNFYVYMQRQNGQKFFLGSETPACSQTSVLFLCATNSTNSANTQTPLVLNYTGGSVGSGAAGQSYLCTDAGSGSSTCNFGGVNNQQFPLANTVLRVNFTQPWLNLQNNYYVGFWQAVFHPAQAGFGVTWSTSNNHGNGNDVVSVYEPNVNTGTTVEGGFFGWVGRALGGAWNFVSGGLSSVVAPALNFGNSILSSIVAAIIQGINLLIQGASTVGSAALGVLQAALNAIGNFFGWGKIGDQFFSFASGVITYFTTGLSDALNWLLRLISRSIDLIKIANNWVNFYLSGLLNFLADGLNTIVEIVTFANKITTFLGTSYVFLVTMFFLWYVADMGLGGVHAWFETMKWLAFISYDFLERMINFGISSITWVFGRIPTLDGTTLPELPTVAIGGGPIWPSTEMTAIREGNFASLFFFATGTVFLVWFETSGLPGSIGSNVTGTAAGNVAPFVNILLILVSVTSLLFVLNIPAKIARGTFGLDDLKPTSLSKFSTGPLATGGVSGHFERRHPQRKARLVINRGLGASGLRPHLRKPKKE